MQSVQGGHCKNLVQEIAKENNYIESVFNTLKTDFDFLDSTAIDYI